MGLVMSPGSVISQLDSMNENLQQAVLNAKTMLLNVNNFLDTKENLKGEAYDSIRNYFGEGHVPTLNAMILFTEAMIQENNTYKNCISSYFSGVNFIDEDGLKQDKEFLERQIDHAYSFSFVSLPTKMELVSSLEKAKGLIEKELQRINDFMEATVGLYQGLEVNSIMSPEPIVAIGGGGYSNIIMSYPINILGNDINGIYLEKYIEGGQIVEINDENIYYSDEYKAAKLANLPVNRNNLPIINGAADAKAYMKALRLLKNSTSMDIPVEVSGAEHRYEDFRKFGENSLQYQLQDSTHTYTDNLGFRRIKIDGLDQPAYMVAMGSYYTNEDASGVIFAVTLENGRVYYCVAGDMKDDKHTNPETHQYREVAGENLGGKEPDIIEFIMDEENEYVSLLKPESKGGKGLGVFSLTDTYSFMTSPIVSIQKLNIPTVLSDERSNNN